VEMKKLQNCEIRFIFSSIKNYKKFFIVFYAFRKAIPAPSNASIFLVFREEITLKRL
jgi:hypothetical protein